MKKVLILIALVLAGCADAKNDFDSLLPNYRGRPVEAVFARWGQPQQVLSGNLGPVYVWTGSMQYQPIAPQTTTGYIGTTPFVVNAPAPAETLSCRVEAHADRQNRLSGFRWDGNNGACQEWAAKLR